MAYARFSTSDLYIFFNTNQQLECSACALGDEHHDSTESMLAHIDRHIEAGHRVPVDLVKRLRDDDATNFPKARPVEPIQIQHTNDSQNLVQQLVRCFRSAGHHARSIENGCAIQVWPYGTDGENVKGIDPATTLWTPDAGLRTGYLWRTDRDHNAHFRTTPIVVAQLVTASIPRPRRAPARRPAHTK